MVITGERAAPTVPTTKAQLLKELWRLAQDNPRAAIPTVAPSVVQTAAELTNAASIFSPDGFPEGYDNRPVYVHAGAPSDGDTTDLLHCTWLQEQCLRVPFSYATGDAEGEQSLYRATEAGTWFMLFNTLRNAPTIQQFNAQMTHEATDNRNLALTAWALPDRVVWFNATHPDQHGTNIFRLGRIASISQNATPNVVDLAPAVALSDLQEADRRWRESAQDASTGIATDFGSTTTLKSYNVLPVTAALRLVIFPRWTQVHDDAHDPPEARRRTGVLPTPVGPPAQSPLQRVPRGALLLLAIPLRRRDGGLGLPRPC